MDLEAATSGNKPFSARVVRQPIKNLAETRLEQQPSSQQSQNHSNVPPSPDAAVQRKKNPDFLERILRPWAKLALAEQMEILRLFELMVSEGRLYYNPGKPYEVRYGTAALWVYDSDNHPDNWQFLNFKINESIHFNTLNEESFEALKKLNPRCYSSWMPHSFPTGMNMSYSMLAAYTYLADEVSRRPNSKGKTVLQAFHDNGVILKQGDEFNAKDIPRMRKNLIAALVDLELYDQQHIKQFVVDWTTKGNFKIRGELQDDDNKTPYKGAYMNLAVAICRLYKSATAQSSACISYALGNRAYMRSLGKGEIGARVAHERTRDLDSNWSQIKKTIQDGSKIANLKMWEQVIEGRKGRPTEKIDTEGELFWLEVFSKLPPWAVKGIYYSGKALGYSDRENISEMIPDGELAQLSDNQAKVTRKCLGLNNTLHNILLFSRGVVADLPDNELTPEVVAACVRRCVIHESTHNILHSRFVDNNLEYHDQARQLKQDMVKAAKDFVNIDAFKYPFVANGSRPGYANLRYVISPNPRYEYSKESWPEELLVIVHTEAETLCPELNPNLSPPSKDEPEFSEIRRVEARVMEFVQKIADLMEQKGRVSSNYFLRG